MGCVEKGRQTPVTSSSASGLLNGSEFANCSKCWCSGGLWAELKAVTPPPPTPTSSIPTSTSFESNRHARMHADSTLIPFLIRRWFFFWFDTDSFSDSTLIPFLIQHWFLFWFDADSFSDSTLIPFLIRHWFLLLNFKKCTVYWQLLIVDDLPFGQAGRKSMMSVAPSYVL